MGLLTNRINNKLEKSNLINGHALNREPVPLSFHSIQPSSDIGYTTIGSKPVTIRFKTESGIGEKFYNFLSDIITKSLAFNLTLILPT